MMQWLQNQLQSQPQQMAQPSTQQGTYNFGNGQNLRQNPQNMQNTYQFGTGANMGQSLLAQQVQQQQAARPQMQMSPQQQMAQQQQQLALRQRMQQTGQQPSPQGTMPGQQVPPQLGANQVAAANALAQNPFAQKLQQDPMKNLFETWMHTPPLDPARAAQINPALPDAAAKYGVDKSKFDQPDTSDSNIDKIANAISKVETGGQKAPYSAQTPAGNGRVALGKYQILNTNVGPWTQQVLGKSMTPQEFLNDPKAQDTVAKARMGQYLQQHGSPQDVASMWFSGRPLANNQSADVSGTSVPQYVNRFNKFYE